MPSSAEYSKEIIWIPSYPKEQCFLYDSRKYRNHNKNICSKCSWTAVWGHVVFVEYGLYMKYIVHVRGVSRPWIHCMFYSQGAIVPFCRVWSPYMESMDLFTGCYALYTPVVCLSVTRVWSLYGVYVRGVSSANGKGGLGTNIGKHSTSLSYPRPIFLISSQISSQIYSWYLHKYILDMFTNIFLISSQILGKLRTSLLSPPRHIFLISSHHCSHVAQAV